MSDGESRDDGGQRYFQEKKIKCFYCRKVGHIFRECKEKEISCFLCKADHEPTRCPLSLICFQCYKRGHSKAECPEKFNRKYCSKCENNSHATMECEKVWRKYKTVNNLTQKVRKYCYLCGESGHFGDDCSTNNFRFRHSAFSQDILDSLVVQSDKHSPKPQKKQKYDHTDRNTKGKHYKTVSSQNDRSRNSSKTHHYNAWEKNDRKGSSSKGNYDRVVKSTSPRIKKRFR